MKKLTVQLAWAPNRRQVVGQVAETGRRLYFEYDPSFIQRGLQLLPFKPRILHS